MSITHVGSGAWDAGSTSLTVAVPTGVAAGDALVVYVGCKPDTATIELPAGWANLASASGGSGVQGIDTGLVRFRAFWKEAGAGETALTVTVTSGNVALGSMHAWRKTNAGTWDLIGRTGQDTTSGTGFSLPFANVSMDPGDHVLVGMTIAGDNATFGAGALSSAGITFDTPVESPSTAGSSTVGNDLAATAYVSSVTAGSAASQSVTGSSTLSAAQTGGGILVRLREPVAADAFPSPVRQWTRTAVTRSAVW